MDRLSTWLQICEPKNADSGILLEVIIQNHIFSNLNIWNFVTLVLAPYHKHSSKLCLGPQNKPRDITNMFGEHETVTHSVDRHLFKCGSDIKLQRSHACL